ncbi:hypothetical protein [Streptomyces sp. NPDC057253]|uniref:hypothetical protein n=1 Tax=Streptomyces sp. NPDC057253 TaxID=3346069 RepID=UPI003633825D
MSHPNRGRAVDDRARAHIKALIDEAKHQTASAPAPAPAQMFFGGMLSGLAAALEIVNGGTAEGSMETIVQKMSAAVGQAYLNGKLPPQPPVAGTAESPPVEVAEAVMTPADGPRCVCGHPIELTGDPGHWVHRPIPGKPALDAHTVRPPDGIPDAPWWSHGTRDLSAPETHDLIAEENAARHRAAIARVDELLGDAERVRALYERWVKAGPPPLGTLISRWWDQRLLELRQAVISEAPTEQTQE